MPMPSSSSPTENWRSVLKFITQCPICSTPYRREQAQLFARQKRAHIVHMSCAQCSSYFVALVMEMGQGISSVGTISDLSFADLGRLEGAPSLTIDDVIAAHDIIKNIDFLKLN